MGGHGGLNILPQKRWNVYNWDNRERVRRDEQEAARQQQEQREQEESEQRETRLSELRRRRNGVPETDPAVGEATEPEGEKVQAEEKVQAGDAEQAGDASTSINQHNIEALFDNAPMGLASGNRRHLQPPEQPKKVKKKTLKEKQEQAGDDDRYRLAYSREGSKQPWYMVAHSTSVSPPRVVHGVKRRRQADGGEPRKKSIEELRAERLEREEKERKRARGLITGPPVKRRYNSSYL